MTDLFLDFETQSEANLKEVGIYNYARHPSTKAYYMAWAFDDNPINLWSLYHDRSLSNESEDTFPRRQLFHPDRKDIVYVAHNIKFEQLILRYVFGIDIPIERWYDTTTIARYYHFPAKLEGLGELVGMPKDMDGHKEMIKLARPRKNGQFWKPWEKPTEYKKVGKYCKRDVGVCRKVKKLFQPPPDVERQLWILTDRMMERGLRVDPQELCQAQKLIEKEAQHYSQKCRALTDGISYSQNIALAEWAGMDSVAASPVKQKLKQPDLDPTLKEVLTIKQQVGSSSIKKVAAMANRCDDEGYIRDYLIFSGASRTHRWSGSGIQPQNYPRGAGKRTAELFEKLYNGLPKPHHQSLKDMLRGFFHGPFLCGDFSQVEARTLAWSAGQDDLIEQFASPDIDPYCVMAEKIYGRSVSKSDKDERFTGKQAVLAAGYQCGWRGFDRMLKETYDVFLPRELLERTIQVYRATNDRIVDLWYRCQEAFEMAMAGESLQYRKFKFKPFGKRDKHGRIGVKVGLPSGSWLYYYQCHYDDEGNIRVYGCDRFTRKWGYLKIYGGALVENFIQSLARDIMAAAMLRLDAASFDLRLTVHDEIIARGEREQLPEYGRIMAQTPTWAKGLPIAVETWFCERYWKG